ncbi:type III PLP-dependent enzyme domain-containing protein [Brevibacterium metallidurans]|uniref:Diaminopimelate decarboxylase n=1 Tax=Brevibacterium metallidurans TaxID=1482676 RepID=A0ABN0SMY6_9MICO
MPSRTVDQQSSVAEVPAAFSPSHRRALAIARIARASASDAGREGIGSDLAYADRSVPTPGSVPVPGGVPALSDASPVIGLLDLDEVDAAFTALTAAFAPETAVLHAVACKAVPLLPVLRLLAEAGAGCEVASPGELELALAAGFAPERIVFDSPAKTRSELRRALDLGVAINVDNWEELDRLDALRTEYPGTASAIGVRINPQTGVGEIGALSTATATSKFGIGLADPGAREALLEAFLARPWLSWIHVHSGSQGMTLDQIAEGVAAAVDLAREINVRAEGRQVTGIDIGGGLPVNFFGDEVTPTFADYRAVLDARVPGLVDFDIITEFGRSLLAKAGTILTRVEYAKTTGGRRIAMTHAGVQVATRTAYAPSDWPLRVLPFTADGRPKADDPAEVIATDVAGPACFAGDLLAEDRLLPRLDAGDLVAVPDTGAYYFSNPFSYNLLPRVPVYGYRTTGAPGDGITDPGDRLGEGSLDFVLIRRGQTIAELLTEAGEEASSPALRSRRDTAGPTSPKIGGEESTMR